MSTAVVKPSVSEALIILDSSVHNIPTAYSNAAGSAIRTGKGSSLRNFAFVNNSTSDIAISLDGGTTDHFVCPASSVCLIEIVRISSAISIRSLSGAAITTGIVYLSVW